MAVLAHRYAQGNKGGSQPSAQVPLGGTPLLCRDGMRTTDNRTTTTATHTTSPMAPPSAHLRFVEVMQQGLHPGQHGGDAGILLVQDPENVGQGEVAPTQRPIMDAVGVHEGSTVFCWVGDRVGLGLALGLGSGSGSPSCSA